MEYEIIIAIISGAVAICVCLISNSVARRNSELRYNAQVQKLEDRLNGIEQIVAYKIDVLTKRIETHNHLVERMYQAEEKISIIEERVK